MPMPLDGSWINLTPPLAELSGTELRLALAEAIAEKPKTWRASALKSDRVRDLTQELVRRGSF